MFVHVRGRGTYSMLEWIGLHNQIFQVAKKLWQKAIALTDLYGMYGAVDFYNKSKGFGIQPLIGVELPYITQLPTNQEALKMQVSQGVGTMTFLIQDVSGYHAMLRIVSQAYTHALDGIPLVDLSSLQENSIGWFALIGGIWSVAHRYLQQQDEAWFDSYLQDIEQCVGKDHLVIDITAQSYDEYPDLRSINDTLIQMAHKHGYMMLTSSGYYYPTQEQKNPYQTALAIKDGKKTYDPDMRKVIWDHHILSEQEVRDILHRNWFEEKLIDTLVDATEKLAAQCHIKITLWQALFPHYDTPDDIKKLYDNCRETLVIDS